MGLDDYYWDGREFKRKDKLLSDLLLSSNLIHKMPSPAPPPLSLQNLLGLKPPAPPPLGNLFARVLSRSPISIWQRFDTLLKRLELTPLQRQDALTKAGNIGRTLSNKYYTLLTGAASQPYRVVGSFMKGTTIAPPTDIDILFVMPQGNFRRFESYSGNGQSAMLQEIRNHLLVSFPNTEIRADGQAVSVPFVSYNAEVVPCFRHPNGLFITPDSVDGGRWKFTHPEEEKRKLAQSNIRSLGNTVKLIKMIKAWKLYCQVEIKSLVIELRGVNFLEKWEHYNKGSVYYDWMIRDFFAELLRFCNGSCTIPGLEEKVQYGDAWKSKAESALGRAQKACDYEFMKKPELAVQEWKKIFGDRFPD